MKKTFALLTVFVLAFALVACGGGVETTTAAPEVSNTEATTTAPETTAKPAETTTAPVTTTEEVTTTEATPADFDVEAFKTALSIKKPENKTPAPSYTVWDGSVAAAFAGGSGTKEDPYLISSGAELAYLAYVVNSVELIPDPLSADGAMVLADHPTLHKHYKLTQDIYLNEVTDISSWNKDPHNVPAGVNLWTPIGLAAANYADGVARNFEGYFDGAGFNVFGMYNDPTVSGGGLFGMIKGAPADVTVAPYSTFEEMLILGIDGVAAYGGVSNLTVAYSFATGKTYVGAIAGLASASALVNCVVDDTVTVWAIGTNSGCGGIVGRINGALYGCINSADIRVIPVAELKEDGSAYAWQYAPYSAGVVGVIYGLADECANFGDVDAAQCSGLFAGYLGGGSISALVTDCYAEGTLHDAWLEAMYNDSGLDRKNIARPGLFVSRTAHIDSHLDNTVEYCVSAGNFASDFDFSYATAVGYIAAQNYGWTGVKGILCVDHGFPEELMATSDWETKASFIWLDIFSVTPEQMAEYRATYAK